MHRVFIGLGSNLGDRQANVLAALQRLRVKTDIVTVSSFYESAPADGASGPWFVNAAAQLQTSLERDGFESLIHDVERAVGRTSTVHLAARLIDIDILAFDGAVHPQLVERPFNAVPLSEIAPEFLPYAPRNGASGVRRRERSLHFSSNRQEEEPDVRLSLNRVGVSGVKRIVRLEIDGVPRVFNGEFSMVADLAPNKSGVHMSRFSEILEEATLDVLSRDENSDRIERIVEAIAREIVQSQRALRADVRLSARFGLERWTPVSGKRGEETYVLLGIAHADKNGTRRAIGVEAEGMTACPCAQLMVREHSNRELIDAGFSETQAQRALDALPVATHNQRGKGSVIIGVPGERAGVVRAEDLVEIVENSMSSETYDLLKRPDEFFVVNKAHRNPKFVEDVVRGILARSLDTYADFDDDAFLFASQINYESIHKHDAFAEGFGLFGELREELRSGRGVSKTDLSSWLSSRPSSIVL
ncbi:MAG: GTP cyclohydrolase MptA [Candidatus Eremiobacteraeota bacterium]|nr:GTP cyclohydrolase MptA [Candidatus Eremiobacteraeota bacterium]